MSGTWSGHPNGQQYTWGICGRLRHIIRARCPNWKQAATWVSLDAVVVQTIGVPLKENVYKATCISILSLFYLYAHVFGLLWNPSPDESIIIILEYTSSNHVKLLDCLSDPHEPLINHIYSEISSEASCQPVNSCFIYIWVHRFPVCTPSFCKKGKPLKPKHWLLRKQLQRWKLL